MFKKLVAIEPISLIPSAQQKLHDYAGEVILFDNIPMNNLEIIQRIAMQMPYFLVIRLIWIRKYWMLVLISDI